MENFKEKLKLQNIFLAIGCGILAVCCFLGFASEADWIDFFEPIGGDSHWVSMWNGFISGATFGVLLLMLFGLVQNIRALKNEKALKKLYVRENDERTEKIYTSAGAAAMKIFLLMSLVAVIAAGYFSVTVSLTILACTLFASFLSIGCKLYYNGKF